MGMDIYFQPLDANEQPIGERQELRCRDIYHTFNRWCEQQDRATPESGERVRVNAQQWKELEPKLREDLIQADLSLGLADAREMVEEAYAWLQRIFPVGAQYVEYWFTV